MFKDILTKEVLEECYIKNNMTIAAIARKFNTCTTTVRKYMKKNKIKFRLLSCDITGQRFGRLIAIRPAGNDK